MRFVHHDLATDAEARDFLASRGVKAAPVTRIDDEIIIGYYPRKLIPALKLDVKVDLSGRASWLADKYQRILGATIRATQQLSPEQLRTPVSWRPESLRDTIVHIISFPELAWRSYQHGSMSTDDMQACRERLQPIQTPGEIAAYGEGVIDDIVAFLHSNNTTGFDRVVPAHYGGEVTVMELLNLILSHSTHHLKQVYWFMETDLGVTPAQRATGEDLAGIFTPEALI